MSERNRSLVYIKILFYITFNIKKTCIVSFKSFKIIVKYSRATYSIKGLISNNIIYF